MDMPFHYVNSSKGSVIGVGWDNGKEFDLKLTTYFKDNDMLSSDNLVDYLVTATVYDVRWEQVYQLSCESANIVTIPVNKEFNNAVKDGSKYCVITATRGNDTHIVGKYRFIIA